jgi:hypothetical protein
MAATTTITTTAVATTYTSPSAVLGDVSIPGAPDRRSIHAILSVPTAVETQAVTARQARLELEFNAVAPTPASEPPTPPTPQFALPASTVA